MEKLNNVVVKNLDREHGKWMVEAFEKLGVNTHGHVGVFHEKDGDVGIYYGVIDGHFCNYTQSFAKAKNARIITLEELEAMIPQERVDTHKAVADIDQCDKTWRSDEGVISAAIELLKENGYKVLKQVTTWEEL